MEEGPFQFSRAQFMNTERESSINLTVEDCKLLADMLSGDAAALPPGPDKELMLKIAEGYRDLAKLKKLVLSKVN
jgi:hypothetical protein